MHNLAFRGLRLPRLGAMRGGGAAPPPENPVYWWDMSGAANMTLDGSGRATAVTEKISGVAHLTTEYTTPPQYLAANDAATARLRFRGASSLAIPDSVTMNKRAMTMVIFARGPMPRQAGLRNGASSTASALVGSFETGQQSTTVLNLYTDALVVNLTRNTMLFRDQGAGGSVNLNPESQFPDNVAAYVIRGEAAASLIGLGNYPRTLGVLDNATTEGGSFGSWNGSIYPAYADFHGALIYDSALSDAALGRVLDWGTAKYGCTDKDADTIIIWDGDSITRGAIQGAPQNDPPALDHCYPAVVALGRTDHDYLNIGRPGGQLAAHTNDDVTLSALSTAVTTGYDNIIMSSLWGINDITAGTVIATMKTNIDSWISNLRAEHSGVVLVGCTVLPFSGLDSTKEAVRVAYNAYVMDSSGSGADFDHRIDTAGTFPSGATSTYFHLSDGVGYLHPNVAGYKVLGEAIETALVSAGVLSASGGV